MNWEELETTVTEERETLRFYPKNEDSDLACVSLGHTDYRARFFFEKNEDAFECYNILSKIKEMEIE